MLAAAGAQALFQLGGKLRPRFVPAGERNYSGGLGARVGAKPVQVTNPKKMGAEGFVVLRSRKVEVAALVSSPEGEALGFYWLRSGVMRRGSDGAPRTCSGRSRYPKKGEKKQD